MLMLTAVSKPLRGKHLDPKWHGGVGNVLYVKDGQN